MRPLRRPLSALALVFVTALALLASGGAEARERPAQASGKLVEVVVTLPRAPLALAAAHDRTLAAAVARGHALDLSAPAAVSYVHTLAAAQRTFAARLAVSVPAARVRWHYTVALDGVSVVLPASQLGRLSGVPGATVWPSVTYHALRTHASPAAIARAANETATLVDAPSIWGPDLSTAGQGLKIGIVDDGVDQAHAFFDPSGYSYPAGFPKGDTAYTTPKVIVARAFPAPGQTWKYASVPFDPVNSDHATHVAGIAAGDYDTTANVGKGVLVSGVAPLAYLGNYKALTVPTRDWGLDGNSPEIAKAVDQAVADGMNVINLSLGEPEIAPRRDIVVRAIDDAAAAGVVPVIASGNDFNIGGRGTINSPGTAPAAITVAASSEGGDGTSVDASTWFSSTGPTPNSLQLKPDVTAPGENVVSSVPPDGWEAWDGTSMATPVVSAAAALLMQRHPGWTVEEIKSALESTGDPVHAARGSAEASTLREGGGRIDVAAADQPLVFTQPTGLSWGLVRRGSATTQQLAVTDAGGGSARWSVSVGFQTKPAGATLAPGAPTVVAGTSLPLTLTVGPNAVDGDGTGFVLLTRGSDVRRIPFWFHVEVPRLPLDPHRALTLPGVYHGDTAGKAANVSSYRYPEGGLASGVRTSLGGPEQVFRVTLRRRVANFGAVVLHTARGVSVSPRLVAGDDENRLVAYSGLPVGINPYQGLYYGEPAVGADLPAPGTYELVFDTPTGAKPGAFSFRFWVNDTKPPAIRLLTRTVAQGRPIRFALRDPGSGVDPKSLKVTRGGAGVPFTYANGLLSARSAGLPRGTDHLTVTAADYQETKNMENVGPVLPNTRVLDVTVEVR
jgi:subtilisin family serine protease